MTTKLTSRWTVWLLGTGLIGWTILCGHRVNVMAADGSQLAKGHLCSGDCETCSPSKATPRTPQHPCVRAGYPHQISRLAKPSRNKRDTFGYVGGSTAWRGEPRCPDEGTWGLDYAGLFSQHHIWLKWLHGRPSRQAGGSYQTDGPHLRSH